MLSLLQDINKFLERYGTVHLHSIIIEIAHRHLLNTEHKERNVWKHFNLREVKEEQGGRGRGEESRACRDMNCHTDDCSRTKAGDVSSAGRSWSRAGFFGIFWACLHCMPDPSRASRHRENTMEVLFDKTWTLSSPFI